MVTSIDISQEIFSIDVLRALKSSLKHRRKHVLRPLQLDGDPGLSFQVMKNQCGKGIKEFFFKYFP